MSELKNYDPKLMSVIVAGRVIDGYADGTFVDVERTNDSFSIINGADGQLERSKTSDTSGTVTITLLQTAEANLFLSGLAAADELSGTSTFPVLIRDSNGNDVHNSAEAWVQKYPATSYAKVGTPRVWVIACAELFMLVGGN